MFILISGIIRNEGISYLFYFILAGLTADQIADSLGDVMQARRKYFYQMTKIKRTKEQTTIYKTYT